MFYSLPTFCLAKYLICVVLDMYIYIYITYLFVKNVPGCVLNIMLSITMNNA